MTIEGAVITVRKDEITAAEVQRSRTIQHRNMQIVRIHIVGGSIGDRQIRPDPKRIIDAGTNDSILHLHIFEIVGGVIQHHRAAPHLANGQTPAIHPHGGNMSGKFQGGFRRSDTHFQMIIQIDFSGDFGRARGEHGNGARTGCLIGIGPDHNIVRQHHTRPQREAGIRRRQRDGVFPDIHLSNSQRIGGQQFQFAGIYTKSAAYGSPLIQRKFSGSFLRERYPRGTRDRPGNLQVRVGDHFNQRIGGHEYAAVGGQRNPCVVIHQVVGHDQRTPRTIRETERVRHRTARRGTQVRFCAKGQIAFLQMGITRVIAGAVQIQTPRPVFIELAAACHSAQIIRRLTRTHCQVSAIGITQVQRTRGIHSHVFREPQTLPGAQPNINGRRIRHCAQIGIGRNTHLPPGYHRAATIRIRSAQR